MGAHETVPVRVWADVDREVAPLVRRLNSLPGVRTHASCRGTAGQGGAVPYGPYVMVSWRDAEALARLRALGTVAPEGENFGYFYPPAGGEDGRRRGVIDGGAMPADDGGEDNTTRARRRFWEAVLAERAAQDRRWGGPAHDDTHTLSDWLAILTATTGKALDADAAAFVRRMVQVAAVALAAAEASRRATGVPPDGGR